MTSNKKTITLPVLDFDAGDNPVVREATIEVSEWEFKQLSATIELDEADEETCIFCGNPESEHYIDVDGIAIYVACAEAMDTVVSTSD